MIEGERKAIFEDCESEKQTNKDKIKKMKDEVKFLQVNFLKGNLIAFIKKFLKIRKIFLIRAIILLVFDSLLMLIF